MVLMVAIEIARVTAPPKIPNLHGINSGPNLVNIRSVRASTKMGARLAVNKGDRHVRPDRPAASRIVVLSHPNIVYCQLQRVSRRDTAHIIISV